jgi:putative NIF3 family GTP cyclohydrolase 1 type 2
VWRYHDHWHRRRPDGILEGFARCLGWTDKQDADGRPFFTLPPTPLAALAREVGERCGGQVVRVTGDPKLMCRRVATSMGCAAWEGQRRLLADPEVDVLICGESREWEACEWTRDAAAMGMKKGLIQLGHANSEEPGMAYLAEWLRPRLPGVSVEFVAAGDPFWAA